MNFDVQMYRDGKGRMTSMMVRHPFPCTVSHMIQPTEPFKLTLNELARDYWIDINRCTTCKALPDDRFVEAFRTVVTETSNRYYSRSKVRIDRAISYAVVGC